jgi:hypothetical protein
MATTRYTKESNVWMVWVGTGIVRACLTERQAKNLVAKLTKLGM